MKKLILVIILLTILIPFTFSFSEESRADLRRAAVWWGERGDKLYIELVDIGRKNPDPSNPNDKNWKEYLRLTSEVQKAEEKQKLYEDTVLFNYYRSISKGTAQTYKPIGDFMGFTVGRGVELVIATITANWTDIVKLAVDSVIKTRIRGKIRSTLDCSEPVPGLENWLVVIGLGDDPWATSFNQAITNWAKGNVESKAMVSALQLENGRQIYNKFLTTSTKISNLTNPQEWLLGAAKRPAEEIMKKLGMVTFIADIAGKMWISFEMDDSIDNTLLNLKAMKDKYKENGQDLSCEDIFLVWSKQKSIDLLKPLDPEDKKTQEELKLGLEFFLKKIPDWTKNNTVPEHFDEIVRMIPIATELKDYASADILREILIKYEYKALTPEEIAASELQSQIEESRGYLISKLKVLRNFLKTKQYDEVESQWDMTKDNWNELMELGYDTDNDTEIQNLWAEIKPMLSNVPDVTDSNISMQNNIGNYDFTTVNLARKNLIHYMQIKDYDRAKSWNIKLHYALVLIDSYNLPQDVLKLDYETSGIYVSNIFEEHNKTGSFTSFYEYNSFIGNPYGDILLETYFEYLYSILEAVENGNKSMSERIREEMFEYLDENEEKEGLDFSDIRHYRELVNKKNYLFKKIDEAESKIENDSGEATTNNHGPTTTNSGF